MLALPRPRCAIFGSRAIPREPELPLDQQRRGYATKPIVDMRCLHHYQNGHFMVILSFWRKITSLAKQMVSTKKKKKSTFKLDSIQCQLANTFSEYKNWKGALLKTCWWRSFLNQEFTPPSVLPPQEETQLPLARMHKYHSKRETRAAWNQDEGRLVAWSATVTVKPSF